ncbi:phiSA1p31-related protein [Streptomyces griseus]|uniref:phiSA1p31-related protein n=1 Tax=Streptomyces griseus TaxID=1911 RepID=UPI003863561F|nr:phiSA1p31-related protein [Streptomyces fimicarius]
MSEFKVGDRAIRSGREVEISYGPFVSPLGFRWAVVRHEDGREDTARVTDLSPVPAKFAVGDRVTLDTRGGERATVEYGPFDGENVYVVKLVKAPTDGNPRTFTALAGVMHPVTEPDLVPVGTRVRVDRATYAERTHGMVGVVTSNTASFRGLEGDPHPYYVELGGVEGGSVYAAEVTPVDDKPADGFEYEGIFYEYGALYRDRDGDLFRFRSMLSDDGTPQGQAAYGAEDGEGGGWHWSLAEVLRDYAPLTKQ